MEPNERLKSWLTVADVSQAEMARRCGYDRHNFNRILSGKSKPTLDLALAIDRTTGGAIPVSAWATETRSEAAA